HHRCLSLGDRRARVPLVPHPSAHGRRWDGNPVEPRLRCRRGLRRGVDGFGRRLRRGALAVELRDAPISSPDLVRVLPAMGRLLLLHGAGFSGLLVLIATSLVIFRTGVYPRWLAWLGIGAAIALLFDLLYLNILPFWTWVFIASLVMLAQRNKAATTLPAGEPRSLHTSPAAPTRIT